MKVDYIEKVFEENYKALNTSASYTDEYISKCYSLGVIDGYMKEFIYKPLIKKEKGLISYEEGYEKGLSEREKDFNKNINIYERKEDFLSRIALFDALNSITSRNLSDEAREIYEKYLVGEYDFNTKRIIPKK